MDSTDNPSSLTRRRLLAVPLLGALVSACSSKADSSPSSTTTEQSDGATPAAATRANPYAALPAELRGVATALYTAKPVAAAATTAKVLRGRKAAPPASIKAATGTWNGTPIATLVAGKDTTLLVRARSGWQIVGGWWPSLGAGAALAPRTHLLVIGSDARELEGQKLDHSNGDVIQVVGVDGRGGGGVMGIARDLYVPLASGGREKINAGLQSGPQAMTRTVANNTGLPLAGYLLIGFEGFQKMIDQLGKVTVQSRQRVHNDIVDAGPGAATLTGGQALAFARERHSLPNGDFDRSFNQGLVLLGLATKVRAAGPLGLPGILTTVDRHVETNLPASTVLQIAGWAYRANLARIGHQVAIGTFGRSPAGASIVNLGTQARAVFARFRSGRL